MTGAAAPAQTRSAEKRKGHDSGACRGEVCGKGPERAGAEEAQAEMNGGEADQQADDEPGRRQADFRSGCGAAQQILALEDQGSGNGRHGHEECEPDLG